MSLGVCKQRAVAPTREVVEGRQNQGGGTAETHLAFHGSGLKPGQ